MMFGNKLSIPKTYKLRSAAVKWRNENIPKFRIEGSRLLQRKPQKHKSSKLPAGISLSYSSKQINTRSYKYPVLSISAGQDENGKPILKILFISKYPSLKEAVNAAVKIRERLIKQHNKKIVQE